MCIQKQVPQNFEFHEICLLGGPVTQAWYWIYAEFSVQKRYEVPGEDSKASVRIGDTILIRGSNLSHIMCFAWACTNQRKGTNGWL